MMDENRLQRQSKAADKEAVEKLMWAGFSRAEAREKYQKDLFGTAEAVPFQNRLESEFFRSL